MSSGSRSQSLQHEARDLIRHLEQHGSEFMQESGNHTIYMKQHANLIRPLVHSLHPYIPGEQPKDKGLIKLNTNENPCPPSPKVIRAINAAVDGRLRLYPNPSAEALRIKLAKLHRCKPENIIVGNGSDELLALATRTFVEPAPEGRVPRVPNKGKSGALGACPSETIQYFTPSYSLYPILTDIHGAAKNEVPLNPDFSLPSPAELRREKAWNFRVALTFITTPNAPSGRGYATRELEALCQLMKGVVVLDEAYVDFAKENALKLALKHPHVIVARTFSKAYSLCFQRVGYFVGSPELIGALHKMRDSYNVNGLGQVAAVATLADLPTYRKNFQAIIATREQTSVSLEKLGFQVLPSQTNFLLVKPPRFKARTWLQKLRQHAVLVRWFSQPEVSDYLRITIGTPAEMRRLVKAARQILGAGR